MLDQISIWALFIGTILIVLFSMEVGFRLGRYKKQSVTHESNSAIGAITTATLGLLAFMLAFTFGLAASRYQDRRVIILDDANAIETTYLRSAYLNEPHRTEIRELLQKYVAIRSAFKPENLKEALAQSVLLQSQLWDQAVVIAQQDSHSVMAGLFIESLNQLIDIHAKRIVAGLFSHVPGLIWFVLYSLTILAMLILGYHSGLTGPRNIITNLFLALSFSIVIYLIADIDTPGEGLIKTNQTPIIELHNKMNVLVPNS